MDVLISADVIEHIADPGEYLRYLRRFCARYYILSSPNRAALFWNGGEWKVELSQQGPPINEAHVTESARARSQHSLIQIQQF